MLFNELEIQSLPSVNVKDMSRRVKSTRITRHVISHQSKSSQMDLITQIA